jgi:hypothetical protein
MLDAMIHAAIDNQASANSLMTLRCVGAAELAFKTDLQHTLVTLSMRIANGL